MKINVRHNLQVYDPAETSLRAEDAYVLPVREAQAVMGETVAAYLERVEWHFDLPTVCRINGEFYGHAEWVERALAVNDNIEFVSRPLGGGSGGSTVKSIASVVALVALSAVAPQLGAMAAGSLLFGGGAATGILASVISAAIVGAGALAVSYFLKPKSGGKTNATDALYTFGFQGNQARPMQPIPVLHGRLKFAPDYAAPTYSDALGDTLTEYGDSLDRFARLRPSERGSRPHGWPSARAWRGASRACAESKDPRTSPRDRLWAWAKRVAGVFRRPRDLAVRYLRPSRSRHAGDVAPGPWAV